MQMHYHIQVNHEAAQLMQAAFIKDRLEHQQAQYCQIPTYLALLHSKNISLYIDLQTVNSNNVFAFQHVFICPIQSHHSFVYM